MQNPRGVLCWEVVIWLHSPQGITGDTGQLAGSKSTQSLTQRKEPCPLLPDFSSAFSCPTPAPAQDQLAPALGWAVVLWEGQTEKLSGCPVPGGTVAPCGEAAHGCIPWASPGRATSPAFKLLSCSAAPRQGQLWADCPELPLLLLPCCFCFAAWGRIVPPAPGRGLWVQGCQVIWAPAGSWLRVPVPHLSTGTKHWFETLQRR